MGVTAPAEADTFTPEGVAPVVEVPVVPPTIALLEGSSATYTVTVTVEDEDTLADLETVVLCLSQTAADEEDCATPDPQEAVKITWARGSDAFAMDSGGSAYWEEAESVSNYDADQTEMNMQFNFQASHAARAGGWTAKVTATDVSDLAGDNLNRGITVGDFWAVKTGTDRESQAFGLVAKLGKANANGVNDGTMLANTSADISYAVDPFKIGASDPMENRGGDVTDEPDLKQFGYDCSPTATFVEGSAVRIADAATVVKANLYANGTVEAGDTTQVTSCRLWNGGGVPVGEYTGEVTVSIGAHTP